MIKISIYMTSLKREIDKWFENITRNLIWMHKLNRPWTMLEIIKVSKTILQCLTIASKLFKHVKHVSKTCDKCHVFLEILSSLFVYRILWHMYLELPLYIWETALVCYPHTFNHLFFITPLTGWSLTFWIPILIFGSFKTFLWKCVWIPK